MKAGHLENPGSGRFIAVLAMAALLAAQSAAAQEPTWEYPKIPSLTLTDEQFLRGAKEAGVPVSLSAELTLPAGAAGPLPAVVLLHGSGGYGSGSVDTWIETFQALGIATLALDSFGGRGFTRTTEDQAQLGVLAMAYDAYRSVDLLAADPRIDPNRIAVMGFSRGGSAVLRASMRRFQRLYGPTTVQIAAYLPFYPQCKLSLVDELDVADAPIRMFHGTDDDWALAAPCHDYADRLRAADRDVVMTEYAGALHDFDVIDLGSEPILIERGQNLAECERREEDGRIINAETGTPFTWQDPCVKLGATIAYNEAAYKAAKADVTKFLADRFKLN